MLLIKMQDTPEGLKVELKGTVDEHADLERIGNPDPAKPLVVNAKEVTRINSIGVKKWRDFFAGLRSRGIRLQFHEVASCLLTQTGVIFDFIQRGEIVSLTVPFYCDDCSKDTIKVYQANAVPTMDLNNLKEKCEKCSKLVKFDELPEEYFSIFLHSGPGRGSK